jgi:hypothetical protein
MRATRTMRRAAACGAITLLIAGCSAEFKLPTESPGRVIPADGSYQLLAEWDGLTNIRDVELTVGSQLFLLFQNSSATGTAPRGSVSEYQLVRPEVLGAPLEGLFNPVALAGTGTRLFVLDQGDTCLARLNPVTSRCDSSGGWDNHITDVDHYWKAVEYGVTGTAPRSFFTDTTLAWVNGIAADASGSVYVSGVAIIILINQDDPRLRDRVTQFRIYKYSPGLRQDGKVDVNVLPAGTWHRDTTFVSEEGSGIGSIVDARGMAWRGELAQGLYVADYGKNWAQKMYDTGINPGEFKIEGATTGQTFIGPTDVAADGLGFVYVLDTGNKRALRFGPTLGDEETYQQRIDIEGSPLVGPTAITADDSLVYVVDRTSARVLRYKRRP